MNDFNKISSLQERNYELQRQLVDINNASVKKFTKKPPELPIVEMKKTKLTTGTPKAIADIALRDLAFQVQLDDLAEKAVVQNKDILPLSSTAEINIYLGHDIEQWTESFLSRDADINARASLNISLSISSSSMAAFAFSPVTQCLIRA